MTEKSGDDAKLEFLAAQIKSLSGYNTSAANSGSPVSDGNPWEIIYVFDGDSSTKVVCEGYSKAFQYLIQRTTFSDSSLECYCMSGNVQFSSGSGGAHMWNMITRADGNYLVDITNCGSTPTVGSYLFMVLPTYENESTESYIYSGATFKYDSTMALLPRSVKLGCRHADHDTSYDVVTEPTCTGIGSGYVSCGHCGKRLESSLTDIEALGHDPQEVIATEATCTEPGTTAGMQCSRCGEWIDG